MSTDKKASWFATIASTVGTAGWTVGLIAFGLYPIATLVVLTAGTASICNIVREVKNPLPVFC